MRLRSGMTIGRDWLKCAEEVGSRGRMIGLRGRDGGAGFAIAAFDTPTCRVGPGSRIAWQRRVAGGSRSSGWLVIPGCVGPLARPGRGTLWPARGRQGGEHVSRIGSVDDDFSERSDKRTTRILYRLPVGSASRSRPNFAGDPRLARPGAAPRLGPRDSEPRRAGRGDPRGEPRHRGRPSGRRSRLPTDGRSISRRSTRCPASWGRSRGRRGAGR